MTAERAIILHHIRQLPIPEQLALIDELWLEATNDVVADPLSDAERELLEARVTDAVEHTAEERDWSTLRDEVLRK